MSPKKTAVTMDTSNVNAKRFPINMYLAGARQIELVDAAG